MLKRTFAAMLLLLVCFTYSCKKEQDNTLAESEKEGQLKNSEVNDYAMTTNDVKFEHNMLVLKDYETLDNLLASFISMREDETYFNNTLTLLGFDPNETTADPNQPYYPVLHRFDQRFQGYNSLRAQRTADEKAFLAAGGDPSEFEDHWLENHYYQTLLNEDGEICIGHHIYKYFSEEEVAIVTIKDWSLYDQVAGSTYGGLQNNPMENVLLANPKDPTDERTVKNLQNNETCQARFGRNYDPVAQTAIFTSTSFNVFVNPDNLLYEWYTREINTGSSTTLTLVHSGMGSAGRVTPALPFSNNSEYEVELRISDNNGCSSTQTKQYSFPGCPDAEFSAAGLANDALTINFEAVAQGANVTYLWTIWEFDDKRNLVGSMSGRTPSFTFPDEYSTYYVFLATSDGSGSCSTEYMKSVTVGCGLTQRNLAPVERNYNNGNRRVTGQINLDNFLWKHTICSETVNYRLKNNGNWTRDKAATLTVGFEPGVYREKDNNAPGGCISHNYNRFRYGYSNRRCVDKVISGNNRLYLRINDIASYHRATDNGSISQSIIYNFY